ncbi:MAG: branched-chain amino acid ABC transporter permease [Pseudomonadota bacterium]
MSATSRTDVLLAIALAVFVGWQVVHPMSGGVGLASLVLVLGLFAIGFNFSFGMAGLLSFGHAAMFGIGGYALMLAVTRLQWGFMPSLLSAAVVGAMLAGAIGMVSLRASGLFFALLTLAFAQLVSILVGTKFRGLFGGADGLPGVPRPALFGLDFGLDENFLLFLIAVFVLATLFAWLLRASPFGMALNAVRANDVRAAQVGLNVQRLRLSAFMLSGAYAAVGGALMASLLRYVSPQMLLWTVSGDVIIMTVLGGSGTLLGPVIGVAVFEILKEELSRLTPHWYLFLGAIFIVSTLYLPRGIAGLIAAGLARKERRHG